MPAGVSGSLGAKKERTKEAYPELLDLMKPLKIDMTQSGWSQSVSSGNMIYSTGASGVAYTANDIGYK